MKNDKNILENHPKTALLTSSLKGHIIRLLFSSSVTNLGMQEEIRSV